MFIPAGNYRMSYSFWLINPKGRLQYRHSSSIKQKRKKNKHCSNKNEDTQSSEVDKNILERRVRMKTRGIWWLKGETGSYRRKSQPAGLKNHKKFDFSSRGEDQDLPKHAFPSRMNSSDPGR